MLQGGVGWHVLEQIGEPGAVGNINDLETPQGRRYGSPPFAKKNRPLGRSGGLGIRKRYSLRFRKRTRIAFAIGGGFRLFHFRFFLFGLQAGRFLGGFRPVALHAFEFVIGLTGHVLPYGSGARFSPGRPGFPPKTCRFGPASVRIPPSGLP